MTTVRTATEDEALAAAAAVEALHPTEWVDAMDLPGNLPIPDLEQAVRDGLLEWSHTPAGVYFRVAP